MIDARRRRLLVTGIAAAAMPSLRARGAPPVRRIGLLLPGPAQVAENFVVIPFMHEMRSLGYVTGANLAIEKRVAEKAQPAQLADMAHELARLAVEVIVAEGTSPTRAARLATADIPIVTGLSDPVGEGFARSLAKPGGNVTGLSWGGPDQYRKPFAYLRAFLPAMKVAAVFYEKKSQPGMGIMQPFVEQAARDAGIALHPVGVQSPEELEAQMSRFGRATEVRGGLLAGIFSFIDFAGIAEIALRQRFAIGGPADPWPARGGLFGTELAHRNPQRRKASMVDRILRGTHPSVIPFELPDVSRLVVNRTTAAKLGLRIPAEIEVLADRMIS